MSIHSALSIGLVAASLALGGAARAEDPTPPPSEPGSSAQACAHHRKAMHGMSSDKQREAYCQAHKDCVVHDCGGMGMKTTDPSLVDPPGPAPKGQPPKP